MLPLFCKHESGLQQTASICVCMSWCSFFGLMVFHGGIIHFFFVVVVVVIVAAAAVVGFIAQRERKIELG